MPKQKLRDFIASELSTVMGRYMIVGFTGAVADWVIFAALVYLAEMHYLIAATISFVLATLINYLLCLRYVFRGGRHARHKEVVYIYLASLVGLLINNASLYVLFEWVGLQIIIAKVLATGSAFIWNFSARHYWIFDREALNEQG